MSIINGRKFVKLKRLYYMSSSRFLSRLGNIARSKYVLTPAKMISYGGLTYAGTRLAYEAEKSKAADRLRGVLYMDYPDSSHHRSMGSSLKLGPYEKGVHDGRSELLRELQNQSLKRKQK